MHCIWEVEMVCSWGVGGIAEECLFQYCWKKFGRGVQMVSERLKRWKITWQAKGVWQTRERSSTICQGQIVNHQSSLFLSATIAIISTLNIIHSGIRLSSGQYFAHTQALTRHLPCVSLVVVWNINEIYQKYIRIILNSILSFFFT